MSYWTGRARRWGLRSLLVAVGLGLAACGDVAPETEAARGVLEGVNMALGLTIVFVVVTGAIVVGAIALDRFLRSRQALTETEEAEEPEEEESEVVAGIGVGRAPVPAWLYGFYVVIPLFAMLYVLNAVALAPAVGPDDEVPPPVDGIVTEITVVARNIDFDVDNIAFPANTEVTVIFDNQDAGIPHDFHIWESADSAAAGTGEVAATSIFPGVAQETLVWETGEPRTYYFNCTVHPSMRGDIEIVEPDDQEPATEEPAEEDDEAA
jgi:plastocyanin